MELNLNTLKDWVDVAASLATVLAVAIGAIWTWRIYRQKRQRYSHAGVTHEVFSYALADGRRILRLGICVENKGEVLVKIVGGEAWVQQIIPIDALVREEVDSGQLTHCRGLEVAWPRLGIQRWDVEGVALGKDDGLLKEIEPHESDTIHVDFVLADRDAEVVIVHSYVRNVAKRRHWWALWKKKNIGWRTETIHELPMMNDRSYPGMTTTQADRGTPLQAGSKPLTQSKDYNGRQAGQKPMSQVKPSAAGPGGSGGDATKQSGPKSPPPSKPPATKSR